MNGLLASKYDINLTIVVINNHGGGIFSFLPISKLNLTKFDQYWTTDPELDIKKIADLYSCKYYYSENLNCLKKNIKSSFNIRGIKIIEVKTIINENILAHQRIFNDIEESINNA